MCILSLSKTRDGNKECTSNMFFLCRPLNMICGLNYSDVQFLKNKNTNQKDAKHKIKPVTRGKST